MQTLLRTLGTALVLLLSPLAHAQYRGGSSISKTGIEFRGSATIGQELLPALIRAYLMVEDCHEVTFAGEHSLNQMVKAYRPDGSRYLAQIMSEGTKAGFRSYLDGEGDVVMSSRRIKPTDVGTRTTLLEPQNEFAFCIDAITVVVHGSNPVIALDMSQLRDIFCGKITDWSQLTTAFSGPIHVFCQPPSSGTMDFFASTVMKGCTLAPNAQPFLDQHSLARQIRTDSLSIGFVAHAFASDSKVVAIAKEPGQPGILPETAALQHERYPLARKLYFYADSTASNPLVIDFLRFVQAHDAARETIQAQGYMPLQGL